MPWKPITVVSSQALSHAWTQQIRSAGTVAAGHAFVQNLRRGRHELVLDPPSGERVRAAFDELARAV
jgi:hypothetical protein